MAGTNNFLVFNEANNPYFTMSDADYLADLYRINGLIPMIADPIAHNKMFRQWSIMISALAGLIASMNYNASDADLATLQANLKSAIEDVAEAKVDTRISNLEDWKDDITATPTEINVLDGITASTSELNILDGITASTAELNTLHGITASTAELNTLHGITASTAELNTLHGITASTAELNTLHGITASTAELNTLHGITANTAELNILHGVTVDATEINYLDGAESNIQHQIDSISGSLTTPFPAWIKNTSYAVGDICICAGFNSYKYLECVVAGTTDTTPPANTNIGQLITDGTAKWLVCDWRDSAPVGSIRQDLIKRDGWLKLNGATINVADYPRLVNFLIANSLIQAYTAHPVATKFTYGDSNNETLIIPNFSDLFIENGSSALVAKSAGLPNITASCRIDSPLSFYLSIDSTDGAISSDMSVTSSTGQISGVTHTFNSRLNFNASRSNSIYGKSSTVQPPAITLIPVIKY